MTDIYSAIDQIVDSDFGVATVCDVLNVSRSAYYAWCASKPTAREQRDAQLMPLIRDIYWQHKRRYGARRIAAELRARGERCSVHRVARLLKSAGLKALQPKSFRPRTTDSRHKLGYSPNLLLEEKDPTGINQLWVGDITYLRLADGSFVYLALIMDRFSRKIIGWALEAFMTEALTLAALRAAIRNRQPTSLIHHSDRGGQYAGREYRAVLRRTGMRQSMSRAANCYDNAFMESCFGTIKTELETAEYNNIATARHEIAQYIAYYNNHRRHSSLNYLTPYAFENAAHPLARDSDSHCP